MPSSRCIRALASAIDAHNALEQMADELPPVRYPRLPGLRPTPARLRDAAQYRAVRLHASPSDEPALRHGGRSAGRCDAGQPCVRRGDDLSRRCRVRIGGRLAVRRIPSEFLLWSLPWSHAALNVLAVSFRPSAQENRYAFPCAIASPANGAQAARSVSTPGLRSMTYRSADERQSSRGLATTAAV
jgi:hypothetical protein